MTLGIWSILQEYSEKFKQFILDHNSNPLLWIGLLFGGLFVCYLIAEALRKD